MPVLPLADVLAHYAASGGNAVALVHEGERWTWSALEARAAAWAERLIVEGVEVDDLVAFALPNGAEFVALAFGIYKAGATPAPLSPKLSAREMREILDIMRPAAIVGDHAGVDRPVPAPATATVAAEIYMRRPAASWKACTSGGSTGRPKVIVDHRPAAFDLDAGFIDLPRSEVVLVPGPLYHNAPFSAAVLGLARGDRLVTAARFHAQATLQLIERERVAWTMLVPTMMHRIWRLPPAERAHDLSSLRAVVHTAAPMPVWLKAAWIEWLGPERIWEVYGATEGIVRTWIGGHEWLERPGSVGRPIGGAQLKVLDTEGRQLPPGAQGEIFAMPASGPASTYHYLGAERRAAEGGWESVGDIGHVDADGYLYLADRRGDLIISGGINIVPAEVEAALLEHPRIESCAVIGLPDDDLGHAVHAVLQASPPVALAELHDFLADRLAPPKHPRSVECQAGPVRDDAGKVRRSQLIADRTASVAQPSA